MLAGIFDITSKTATSRPSQLDDENADEDEEDHVYEVVDSDLDLDSDSNIYEAIWDQSNVVQWRILKNATTPLTWHFQTTIQRGSWTKS